MNMELNKIMGAVLSALLFITAMGHIADGLVHIKFPENPSYPIDGVVADSENAGSDSTASGAGLESIDGLLANANVTDGQVVAKKCLSCHTLEKGGANKVGPNLWGVVGQSFASVGGFAYSDALKGKQGTWGYDDLNQFLYQPQAYAKGTKMSFVGIKKTQERANLIAFLRTLNDQPLPLPPASTEPSIQPVTQPSDESGKDAGTTAAPNQDPSLESQGKPLEPTTSEPKK